jgi:hypothetical protein
MGKPKVPPTLQPSVYVNSLQLDKLRDYAGGIRGISDALRDTNPSEAFGLGAALKVISDQMCGLLEEADG